MSCDLKRSDIVDTCSLHLVILVIPFVDCQLSSAGVLLLYVRATVHIMLGVITVLPVAAVAFSYAVSPVLAQSKA